MKQSMHSLSTAVVEKPSLISKVFIFMYGVLCYLFFFGVILYLIGFMGNLLVPKGVDTGTSSSLMSALCINIGLIALFGVQHSVMARPTFKAWITQYLPQSMERSTFVLMSSLVVAFVMWQWQPMTEIVWSIKNPIGKGIMYGLFAMGWGLLFLSTFLIDHFELFGLKQGFQQFKTYRPVTPTFKTPWLYKLVRHPMMVGIMIGLWATPLLTIGHGLFAFSMTLYILIGIHFEEKDLVKTFGDEYRAYQKKVPKIIPDLSQNKKS